MLLAWVDSKAGMVGKLDSVSRHGRDQCIWNDGESEEGGRNPAENLWEGVGGMACEDKTVHTGCLLKGDRTVDWV